MKILLVAALLCISAYPSSVFSQGVEMPRRTCHDCVITKEYNAVKDSTKVLLKQMSVAEVPGGNMYLALGTTYYGGPNKTVFSKVVMVTITFIAKPLVEAKETELTATVDEKAISFGRLTLSVNNLKYERKISMYMAFSDWEEVAKLAQAKKAQMRFNGIDFQLTDEHKAALLDFLAYGAGDPWDQ